MKYVYIGKNHLNSVKSAEFSAFLKDTQTKEFEYTIKETYKGPKGLYITSVEVSSHLTHITRVFEFDPSEFITNDLWKALFQLKETYIQSKMCGTKFVLRKTDISNKYSVTSSIVKHLYTRNSVWKLAIQRINKGEPVVVIPLGVKGGKITKFAFFIDNIVPHTVEYKDHRVAPSIEGFLNIYREVEEQIEPFITQEIADNINKLTRELISTSYLAKNHPFSSEYSKMSADATEKFSSFIKSLVK